MNHFSVDSSARETTWQALVTAVKPTPRDREALEAEYGQVWTISQMIDDFEVLQFAGPFIVVRRLSDGVKGCLMFQDEPRFYWGFDRNPKVSSKVSLEITK